MKDNDQKKITSVNFSMGELDLMFQIESNASGKIKLNIIEQNKRKKSPVPEPEPKQEIPECLPPEAEQDLVQLLKELNANDAE